MNLVTSKEGAKHELLFNELASGHTVVPIKSDLDVQQMAGSLNKSSHLAPALGVTKFILFIDMILVTL